MFERLRKALRSWWVGEPEVEVPKIVVRNIYTPVSQPAAMSPRSYGTVTSHTSRQMKTKVCNQSKPDKCPNCRSTDTIRENGDGFLCSFCGQEI